MVEPGAKIAGWDDPNGRDMNFTDDMLDAISNDLCIDESRVFTTGFSFGGAISYKLACERTDTFRAALVYGTGPVSGNNASACQKPIAFFQTHGQDDKTFNIGTGLGVLDIFVGTNGCTDMNPPLRPRTSTCAPRSRAARRVIRCDSAALGAARTTPRSAAVITHRPRIRVRAPVGSRVRLGTSFSSFEWRCSSRPLRPSRPLRYPGWMSSR